MPLEDDLSDILKKSRHGQGLTVEQVAKKCGLSSAVVSGLERGEPPQNREVLATVAAALGLRAEPLAAIAIEHWSPEMVPAIAGIETVRGDIGGYEVKGYLVHDHGEAVMVDTGYDAPAMLALLDRLKLKLVGICLTHGHVDHAGGLERILANRKVPVYLGRDDDPLLDWHPPQGTIIAPEDGRTLSVGRLTIGCMTTPGHTPGGICYHVDLSGRAICFVGDTLFAGSIGRANPSMLYPTHLESVRKRVLTLSEDTVLFPGHGPSTTVREERTHNPFAAFG